MVFNKKKAHTRLENHEQRLESLEFNNAVLTTLFFAVGFIGLIAVMFFDPWRGRPHEWGWIQIAAIPVSIAIMAAAILLNKGRWE